MFVANTLALSLVFSPVTALTQAPIVSAPAAGPSAKPAEPAGKPAAKSAEPAAGGKAACPKLDYRARVEVDAAKLGLDGQGIAPRLRVKAEEELKRNDIMGAGDGQDVPVLYVKLEPLPGDDGGFHYTVDINHGELRPIKDGSSVGECPLCTESELLEKIVGATRALTPKLRAYVADFNNKPCEPSGPASCESDAGCKDPALPKCSKQLKQCVAADECATDADCGGNSNGPACHPVIKKCVPRKDIPKTTTPSNTGRGMMIGGGILVAAGLGGVITGAVFIGKNTSQPDAMNGAELLNWRTPGIGVLVTGIAFAAVGGALLGLGAKKRRTQVAPVAGAGVYGLSWSGRF